MTIDSNKNEETLLIIKLSKLLTQMLFLKNTTQEFEINSALRKRFILFNSF